MSMFRVALANVRPASTPEESVAIARDAVLRAARERAAIVCFPECYVPGYRTAQSKTPIDAAFLDRAWSLIADAADSSGIAVILGTERIVDGKPCPTALVIDPNGTLVGFQDKVQLDPSEDDMYVCGSERRVFDVGGVMFGVAICHEGFRYPETVRFAAKRGAKIVFHPHVNWPEPGAFCPATFGDSRNTFHEKAMLCRAAENTIYFASVNCAYEGSGTTSAVARPDGTVLAWQPYGEEGLLLADLDLSAATGLLAMRCRSGA